MRVTFDTSASVSGGYDSGESGKRVQRMIHPASVSLVSGGVTSELDFASAVGCRGGFVWSRSSTSLFAFSLPLVSLPLVSLHSYQTPVALALSPLLLLLL